MITDEIRIAGLLALAAKNVPTDIQEAFLRGNGKGWLPGSLDAAFEAVIVAARTTAEGGVDHRETAMHHLGNVLSLLAELHDDDRCVALDKALAFYNERNPDALVEPVDGYFTRLVQTGPLDRIADGKVG